MTKNDIKQYLGKIYKVDVLDVTTTIQQGSNEDLMEALFTLKLIL